MDNINYKILYKEDPYKKIKDKLQELEKTLKIDTQGWMQLSYFFAFLIYIQQPKLIVEVGSWKGLSACFMAQFIKEMEMDTKIICVDTWLGGEEHWQGFDVDLYEQFMFNVIKLELDNIIIPFRQTSTNAYRIMKKKNIIVDMAYIDGSHEFIDVYTDCLNYYDLLSQNGLLMGDDIKGHWVGVKDGVSAFANKTNQQIGIIDDKIWFFDKSNMMQTNGHDLFKAFAQSNLLVSEKRKRILLNKHNGENLDEL